MIIVYNKNSKNAIIKHDMLVIDSIDWLLIICLITETKNTASCVKFRPFTISLNTTALTPILLMRAKWQ